MITCKSPLTALDLLELRGGNALAMGVPTNAIRASTHRLGQRASLAVYQCAEHLDGISRRPLTVCPELAPILNTYQVALV